MATIARRRPYGCAYCYPLPGERRPAEPEPGCTACAAWEWAPIPAAVLTRPEWDTITGLLDVRCGGYCEGCGLSFVPGVREPSNHHRRNKGSGGTDDATINGLANLLRLCGGKLAGVQGCHGRAETLEREIAEGRGLIVRHDDYLAGDGRPPEVDLPVAIGTGRPGVYRRVLLDPRNPFYLAAPGALYVA